MANQLAIVNGEALTNFDNAIYFISFAMKHMWLRTNSWKTLRLQFLTDLP
jgi:hypothetical protein